MHLKLNSDLYKTDLFEELIFLEKLSHKKYQHPYIKIYHMKWFIRMYSNVVMAYKRLLAVELIERSLLKLKIIKNYQDLVFAKTDQNNFQLYWSKKTLQKQYMIWSPICGSKYPWIEEAKCYDYASVYVVYVWV